MSSVWSDLIYPTNVQNLTTLALAISEIRMRPPKFKMGYVT